MFKKSLYAVLLLISLFLAGCQSAAEEQIEKINTDTPEVGEMVPFSRGPSTPPGVKGPSADPGAFNDVPVVEVKLGSNDTVGIEDTPQSVTEVEDVTYTLKKEGE